MRPAACAFAGGAPGLNPGSHSGDCFPRGRPCRRTSRAREGGARLVCREFSRKARKTAGCVRCETGHKCLCGQSQRSVPRQMDTGSVTRVTALAVLADGRAPASKGGPDPTPTLPEVIDAVSLWAGYYRELPDLQDAG